LDWNYLAYVLQSPVIQNKLHGISFGATVPHIKVGDAEHLEIPYPPLSVQKAIGDTLASYDDLIENNRRRIALLEESARLLYREWFVHLRFPGAGPHSPNTRLPDGWRVVSLGDLISLKYGKSLKDSDRIPGDVPVFGSSGIVGSHIKALVEGPAIIVGRKGNVGSVFYSQKNCFPIDTVYFVNGQQATFFNLMLLMSQAFVSSDTAVPGLNRTYAHALPVVQPSEDVLNRFEVIVSGLYQQIGFLVTQNSLLTEARDALLTKLMSGEIAV
jgi:type I restriction enzyme S subunit